MELPQQIISSQIWIRHKMARNNAPFFPSKENSTPLLQTNNNSHLPFSLFAKLNPNLTYNATSVEFTSFLLHTRPPNHGNSENF